MGKVREEPAQIYEFQLWLAATFSFLGAGKGMQVAKT
jgi:hypothetical protein